ncbi:hypothetical protein JMUB7530_27750 [Staphylococcus aureus]
MARHRHRIDPGWSGCIVLEFYNSGKLPLAQKPVMLIGCLLYTSDAADELDGVDLGGRRIIKKLYIK